jgi:hypothetical protein
MSQLMSLLQASAKFALVSAQMEAVSHAVIEEACRMVAKEARRVLGTYDYGWPSLKSATVGRKGKDTPGVDTGAMRDSIEWTARGMQGEVGSNHPRAEWFELGTKNQPPRSFLAGAVRAKGRDIQKMAGRTVAGAMGAHHLLSPEMRHLLHLAKKIGHEVKDLVTVDEDNEKGRR